MIVDDDEKRFLSVSFTELAIPSLVSAAGGGETANASVFRESLRLLCTVVIMSVPHDVLADVVAFLAEDFTCMWSVQS